MKILFVIGEKQSGKTTFGKMLAEELGCCQVDTSEIILKQYEAITGEPLSAEEKERYRPHLINLGDLMCSRDPARIVRLILSELDDGPVDHLVICGLRRRVEYFSSLALVKELGGRAVTLLVTRPSIKSTDNFELQNVEAKHIVINNSSRKQLGAVAKRIAIIELRRSCGGCGAIGYSADAITCVQCGEVLRTNHKPQGGLNL